MKLLHFALAVLISSITFSQETGMEKWFFSNNMNSLNVRSTPAIDNNGIIYFGSDNNYIYAVNSDGSLKLEMEYGFLHQQLVMMKLFILGLMIQLFMQ